MEKYIVNGGKRLEGQLEVYSAKNCVLALLAASILTEKEVIIHKCPLISDVFSMIKILQSIGCKVRWQADTLVLDCSVLTDSQIPSEYAKEIRSSLFLMGSLLSRQKKATASFPGGCEIGIRPIDLHLKGFKSLNIQVTEEGGYLYCDGAKARGGTVHLDFPSVGATENIILAAVLLKGTTRITNAAKEPEIVSLQDFLNAMGAKVKGAGTDTIEIEGVKKLGGVEFTPIPDRIVAGTYLIAAAMTQGELLLTNCIPRHIESLTDKLKNTTKIITYDNGVYIRSDSRPQSVPIIETMPYPSFPTDLQAQMLALQTISEGSSMVVENIFETRFKHIAELTKMGADIVVKGKIALVRGVKKLHCANVTAHDLRGGAALVLAALAAEGKTEIDEIRHIQRGYCDLDKAFNSVGAEIASE